MQYCQECGNKTIPLTLGGCGGFGGMDGCLKCDAVFTQTTGGILATADGESYGRNEWSCKELCWHLAKELTVNQNTHKETWDKKPNDTYLQWYWSEVGFGETHYFDTQDEAKSWLCVYVQTLKDNLGWPHCDSCGQMSEKDSSFFHCHPCKLTYVRESLRPGHEHPAVWVRSDYSDLDEKIERARCASG